jgi:hypothetical protein
MKHQVGQNRTGGTRSRPSTREADRSPVAIGPCAEHVALVQALLGARSQLRPSSLAMALQMARTAQARPLTPGQVAWLREGVAALGLTIAPASPPSFGPLPLRPPCRAA